MSIKQALLNTSSLADEVRAPLEKETPERNKKRADSISKVKKGKPLTESHKQALKKPKDKIKNYSICEICGVYTTKTVISRNHGKDKCKK